MVFLGQGPGLEPRLDPPHSGHFSWWSSKVLTRFMLPICDNRTALRVVMQSVLCVLCFIFCTGAVFRSSVITSPGRAQARGLSLSKLPAWILCSVSQQFQNFKGVQEQQMGPDAGSKAALLQKRKEWMENTRCVPKTADASVSGNESGLDVKIVHTLSTRPD